MRGKREITIALAGNPNSGKTSIFNGLTGARRKVANFPGVTVEKRVGHRKFGRYSITVIDLPGTYNLTAYSPDEKVARDFIINNKPDVVINVVDSGNLERSLYMTMQLVEMEVDLIIDLNMWDEVTDSDVEIDTDKLSRLLGAPVVKTIGNRAQGIDGLLESAISLVENRQNMHRHPPVSYGPKLDDIVLDLSDEVIHCRGCPGCRNPRWMAVKLLEGDEDIRHLCLSQSRRRGRLARRLEHALEHVRTTTRQDPEVAISEGRYGYIAGIVREVMKKPPADRMKASEQIDNILTHRYLGYPIFLVIMWLIFQATFTLGAYPMEWIDAGVAFLQQAAISVLPAGAFSNLIVEGVIGGVGSVAVFLPNIIILFLGISVLEDSGYLARAAFLMDKLMHFLGLHGKSFIPMLMGFGCSVPAIMSTRTLESRRDRIMTILIVPLMSCSARLPVYILFTGAFFGAAAGNVIFSIYLLGIAVAIIVARLMRRSILKSEDLPFVMELPPYRVPTWRSVVIHMWERAKIYLKKMGGVILIASMILWALGYFPRKSEYSRDYQAQIEQLESVGDEQAQTQIAELEAMKAGEELKYSFIGRLGGIVGPVVAPLGFNWQMGTSLVTGFAAKEVVVSSLGVLYHLGREQVEESETLIRILQSPESGVSNLAAYAFMVFVLLYTPCIATVVIIKQEIGWKWMLFSVFFQTAIAWSAAFVIYQGGRAIGL
ncbi:MAG: ferrous iron transport protein B [Candidatus Zixiibacteriota bacterium]|nr:MAG: ferrous iron transport protein B [candidate division Zixibacteria bacterium]